MKGVPYKSLAKFVVNEITKCEDEEIICKFVSEMCKLGRLKKGYKIPKIIKESERMSKEEFKTFLKNSAKPRKYYSK